MHNTRIILVTLGLILSGCSRAPVVTITNHSTVTLSNVVVSGSGFTHQVPIIAPGAEHRMSVRPSGESALRVEFDAAGRHIDSGQQGYFDGGGYRVSATVSTNLDVSVTSDSR